MQYILIFFIILMPALATKSSTGPKSNKSSFAKESEKPLRKLAASAQRGAFKCAVLGSPKWRRDQGIVSSMIDFLSENCNPDKHWTSNSYPNVSGMLLCCVKK